MTIGCYYFSLSHLDEELVLLAPFPLYFGRSSLYPISILKFWIKQSYHSINLMGPWYGKQFLNTIIAFKLKTIINDNLINIIYKFFYLKLYIQ